MGSPPRTAREEEQRLNMRTLVIASAASATAALVTSRLWIAGTWIAAAMTPVLVTLVSELLRRPTDALARGITVDRPALPDPEAPAPPQALRPESAAAQRVAERLRRDDHALPDPDAPPQGAAPPGARGGRPGEAPSRGAPPAPTRVYRSEAARRRPARRRIAYRVVFGTAALAFVIGVLALTVPELIAGGSVGKNDGRTTLFGGSKKSKDSGNGASQTPQKTTTEQTDTSEQPTTSTEEPTTPETETTPTTTEQPPGEPTPTETTPTTPTQP
jgi:hypothetical protein